MQSYNTKHLAPHSITFYLFIFFFWLFDSSSFIFIHIYTIFMNICIEWWTLRNYICQPLSWEWSRENELSIFLIQWTRIQWLEEKKEYSKLIFAFFLSFYFFAEDSMFSGLATFNLWKIDSTFGPIKWINCGNNGYLFVHKTIKSIFWRKYLC